MVVDSKIAQSLISLKMATACSAVAKAFQQDTAARYHSSQHEFWMILGVPLEPASWNSCSCIWTCLGERFPVNSSLKNPGMGWVMMAILSAVPPIVIHFGNHLKCSS